MAKSRVRVLTMDCRRGCGRKVATISRSIVGADAAHAKFHGICSDCITPEELEEMQEAQTAAMLRTCRGY